MPAPRRLRDARGPVAATVATSAALLTHLAGGGALPSWLGILVPWVLSLAVCTALAGRRLSLWRTTASVALSQALFHTLFVLGAPTASGGSAGRHPGHGMPGVPATPSAGIGAGPAAGSAGPSAESSAGLAELLQAGPAMWFWHGVAVVATVVALYRGERLLARLRELAGRIARRVRRRIAVPASVVLPYPVVRVPAPGWFSDSFSARPERSPLRRRGPPRAAALLRRRPRRPVHPRRGPQRRALRADPGDRAGRLPARAARPRHGHAGPGHAPDPGRADGDRPGPRRRRRDAVGRTPRARTGRHHPDHVHR